MQSQWRCSERWDRSSEERVLFVAGGVDCVVAENRASRQAAVAKSTSFLLLDRELAATLQMLNLSSTMDNNNLSLCQLVVSLFVAGEISLVCGACVLCSISVFQRFRWVTATIGVILELTRYLTKRVVAVALWIWEHLWLCGAIGVVAGAAIGAAVGKPWPPPDTERTIPQRPRAVVHSACVNDAAGPFIDLVQSISNDFRVFTSMTQFLPEFASTVHAFRDGATAYVGATQILLPLSCELKYSQLHGYLDEELRSDRIARTLDDSFAELAKRSIECEVAYNVTIGPGGSGERLLRAAAELVDEAAKELACREQQNTESCYRDVWTGFWRTPDLLSLNASLHHGRYDVAILLKGVGGSEGKPCMSRDIMALAEVWRTIREEQCTIATAKTECDQANAALRDTLEAWVVWIK